MNDPSEFPVLVDEATRECEAQRCWSRIGVHGDRSCPEIPKYVHCRNCPVYIQAGAHLFDREPPREWLDEHKTRLAEIDAPLECDTITVLIFRLAANTWRWMYVPCWKWPHREPFIAFRIGPVEISKASSTSAVKCSCVFRWLGC